MKELENRLQKQPFTFAKTYAKTAPHEYIVKGQNPELFDDVKAAIKEHGYNAKFGKWTYRYLNIGEYKYWAFQTVLNREPIKGYK